MMVMTQLQEFRQAIYHCLGKARDAVFELMDAVLVSPSIPSFVSLSQSPVFRRTWPSVYAALQDSRLLRRKLMKLLTPECVYGAVGAYKGRGSPCKHGYKFKLNDPETWPDTDETVEVEDEEIRQVRLIRWSGFHFQKSPKRENKPTRLLHELSRLCVLPKSMALSEFLNH